QQPVAVTSTRTPSHRVARDPAAEIAQLQENTVPTNAERIARLERLREEAQLGGGEARIAQQHERGKLTARERLDLLLDAGSFVELDAFVTSRSTAFGLAEQRILGDGVVTGHGTVD